MSISTSTTGLVSFNGIASGLPTQQIIQAETSPESAIVTDYNSEIGTLTNADTAWQSILTDLQALGTQAAAFSTAATFQAMAATSNNTQVATAAAQAGTPAATYDLTVNQLAQAQQSISSGADASATAQDFGTGTLTIQVGSNAATTVHIGATQNSLDGIAAAINAAAAGVSAVVTDTRSGYQLLLVGQSSGAANAFTVTDGLSGGNVALGPFSTVQAAQDASVTLGSGSGAVTTTSPGNTDTTLATGLTVTLVGTGSATITVAPDTATEVASVQSFVTAYNQVIKDINAQNAFNTSTDQPGGPLFGDPTLGTVLGLLSDAVGTPITSAPEAVNSFPVVGISTNADNTLSVDTGTLTSALQTNPQGVQELMAGVGAAVTSALSGFDEPVTGTIPEEISANQKEIATLQDAVTSLNQQIAQEQSILQQEFIAMEQEVAQAQGSTSLLAQFASMLNTSPFGASSPFTGVSTGSGSGGAGGGNGGAGSGGGTSPAL
jgi:flagellar hook-associated protein 2